MKQTTALRQLMDSGKTAVAIGAYDAFSALLVEKSGFDAIYIGSYSTEAAFLGKPDLGLMSKTERLLIVRNVVKSVGIPVIADAEEGYGNAISVVDAVRDFEAAGVAAIHLDDEAIPCKCPFLPGIPNNQLIATEEMCGKIEAAVSVRKDPDFLIIARSDVIGTMPRAQYYKNNGIETVVQRSNAYAAAGADAIFVMALNEKELKYFAKEIRAPLVGVFAPAEPLPVSEFQSSGYRLAIGSVVCLYAAAKGVVNTLQELKRTGDWNAIVNRMITDKEFFDALNLDKYQSYYEQFRIP